MKAHTQPQEVSSEATANSFPKALTGNLISPCVTTYLMISLVTWPKHSEAESGFEPKASDLCLVFFLHHYSASHPKDPRSQTSGPTSTTYKGDPEVQGYLKT